MDYKIEIYDCFVHTGQNCEDEKLFFSEIINDALFLSQ